MSNGEYTLGYWAIRGIGAPVRMAFAYAERPLKQDIYTDFGVWQTKAKALEEAGHAFPNLPYLTFPDGKTTIVQSNAIVRHIARELNLFGDTSDVIATARLEELLEQFNDMRVEAVNNYYSEKGQVSPDFITGTLPYYYGIAEKLLTAARAKVSEFEASNVFFTGLKPTIVDFMIYEIMRVPLGLIDKEAYAAKYPNTFAFFKAVEQLPTLAGYFKSDQYLTYTANAGVACYNHVNGSN